MDTKSCEEWYNENILNKEIPKPPKPPQPRILKEGCLYVCKKCGSSMVRKGFLGLFGERLCINKKCKNSITKYKRL